MKAGRMMAKQPVDLFHAYGPVPTLPAAVAARRMGVPLISERYNLGHGRKARHIWLAKIANATASVISVNSDAVGEVVVRDEGGRSDKLHLIRTGIPIGPAPERLTDFAVPASDRAPLVVMCVGNCRWVKNQKMIIDSIPLVLKRFSDVEFHFVGDGPELENLKAQAERLGVSNKVVFHGRRPDAPTLLTEADIFALTSKAEGHSRAVLEAMQCSLPVVATRLGGFVDEVIEGENGYLVELGDVGALAQSFLKLLGDAELRMKMGRAGRCRVEEFFTLEKFYSRQLQLYKDLLARER
ncbi:glycosyltransferase family 4 protein [Desulfovibrio ferrophilus]|nr:glycosyltransferase family 4 protein [Desulfovibrio ferrophilus]